MISKKELSCFAMQPQMFKQRNYVHFSSIAVMHYKWRPITKVACTNFLYKDETTPILHDTAKQKPWLATFFITYWENMGNTGYTSVVQYIQIPSTNCLSLDIDLQTCVAPPVRVGHASYDNRCQRKFIQYHIICIMILSLL